MKSNLQIFNNLGEEAKQVLSLIQKKGPLAKSQLMLMTGMKLTTLNRIMEPLEANRLVVEYDIGESTGGRKPVLYDVNTYGYYVIGIDISRLYTQIVITDLKMNMLNQHQFVMDSECTPEVTMKHISSTVNDQIARLGIEKQMVLGVGLGTVGPLDRKSGVIVHPAKFESPDWLDVPVKSMLETELNLPVVVDNGANTAVLAEYLYGDGRSFENIAYFNCGMGIRTGAISSGTIIRTMNDAEDAFGHMMIDIDGEQCSCGNYGCIECYSSIHSIVKKFISSLKRGKKSIISKPVEKINYIDICHAADQGDELSREIITDGASIFGLGLANYINLLNPGIVILSGPLIVHSNLFYSASIDIASDKCYLREKNKVIFSKGGHFKENAISVGGAVMFIEHYLKN